MTRVALYEATFVEGSGGSVPFLGNSVPTACWAWARLTACTWVHTTNTLEL